MRKGSFWLQSDKLIIKSSAKIFSQEEHSYEESELEQTENKEESIEKSNIEEIKPQTFENEEQVSECKIPEPKQQTFEPKYGQTFRETLKNLNFSEQTIYQTNEMFNNKYQQNSEKGKNIQQNNENRRNSQQNTCNSFHVSLYRKISNGFDYKNQEDQIPDSVINNLIDNFLNKRFQTRNSQLNARENSTIKDYGYEKWDILQLIKHKETKEYGKMLRDKYGYKKEEKKSETIPLSFYFDLSGSMVEYSHILSLIAIKILQKKIKLLIGYNDRIVYQINELPSDKKISVEDFQKLLNEDFKEKKIKNEKIDYEIINKRLDEFLIENEAEKVALFTDFDPIEAIRNLSKHSELYWFCFEKNRNQPFIIKGRFYRIQNLKDIILYFKNPDMREVEKPEEDLWR